MKRRDFMKSLAAAASSAVVVTAAKAIPEAQKAGLKPKPFKGMDTYFVRFTDPDDSTDSVGPLYDWQEHRSPLAAERRARHFEATHSLVVDVVTGRQREKDLKRRGYIL